jgi:hypothetical protein
MQKRKEKNVARAQTDEEAEAKQVLEAGRNSRRTSRLKVARPTYDVRGLELRDDDGRDDGDDKDGKDPIRKLLARVADVEGCERGDTGGRWTCCSQRNGNVIAAQSRKGGRTIDLLAEESSALFPLHPLIFPSSAQPCIETDGRVSKQS